MIQMPRRSVTRFFIPLIDVLTLLFCVFLLMPLVKAGGEADESNTASAGTLSLQERQELESLRRDRRGWRDLEDRLRSERAQLEKDLQSFRRRKIAQPQEWWVPTVLEVDGGKLYFYDGTRPGNPRSEVTEDNVDNLIEKLKKASGNKEPLLVIRYPARGTRGFSVVPGELYRNCERWFKDVAHGYDTRYHE